LKGIVLAGGAGTRLYPLTLVASKQLQPVYDKPMIYYPLATLMLAGIREILLISTPEDTPRFEQLLGDGGRWGIRLSYAVQPRPEGIAQAFLVGEDFIAGERVALILGDNILYGRMNLDRIVSDFEQTDGAVIFGYPVQDPERYGIVEFGPDGEVVSLEEKPARPRTNLAVPGIYLYDREVVERTKSLRPSARGELEITDLNLSYFRDGKLRAYRLGRGIAWLDTGTQESLLEAANFIATVEHRLKISCLEEIAFRRGYVDRESLASTARGMPPSPYREYIERTLEES
jgi:glucose-1-phosphate thymidylyltransferase